MCPAFINVGDRTNVNTELGPVGKGVERYEARRRFQPI
jgi:hypothetical protein